MNEKEIALLTSPVPYDEAEAMDYSWLEVTNENQFVTAGNIKKDIEATIKTRTDWFSPRKKVADASHKYWVSAEKGSILPWQSAKAVVVRKMNEYLAKKESIRKLAVTKLEETGGFVPPAPKEKGVRITYKGEVNNPAEFIAWVVKNNLIDDYLTIKTAPLNTLAKAISSTDTKIPGFEAVKNVSAV